MRFYDYVLRAKDEFSDSFNKLQGAAGVSEGKINNVDAGLRRAADSASGLDRVVSTLKKTLIGAFAVTQIYAFGKSVVGTAMTFDAQMSKVQAITKSSGEDLQMLRDTALDMGRKTRFSATEAGEGLEFLGMAGFGAKDSVSALPGVMNLAAAAGMELGRSADIASNLLSMYGLKASETSRLTDVLAATATSANTNIEQLSEGMKYLGPIANSLGVSLEESSAMIGILADNGLQGSIATRALATSLGNLAKPSKEVQETMDRLGVSVFDNQGKFKGLAGMIGEVEKATAGMSDQQKLSTITTLFGAEASKQILTMLNATKDVMIDGEKVTLKGAKALEGYTGQLEKSGGAAAEMARLMNDNLAGDLISLGSAWEGFVLKFMEGSDSIFRPLVQSATSVVRFLTENMDRIRIVFDPVFKAISPLTKLFSVLWGKVKDGYGALGGLEGFFNLIGNILEWVNPLFEFLHDTLSLVVDTFIDIVTPGTTANTVLSVMAKTAGVAAGIFLAYKTGVMLSAAWTSILTARTLAANAVTILFSGTTSVLTGGLALLNAVMLANPIGAVLALVVGLTAGFIALYNHCEEFRGFLWGLWDAVKKVFENIWNAAKRYLGGLGDLLIGIFTMDTEKIKSGLTNAFGGVKDLYSKAGEGVADSFNNGFQKGVDAGGIELPDFSFGLGNKNFFGDDKISTDVTGGDDIINRPPGDLPPGGTTPKNDGRSGIDSIAGGGGRALNVTINVEKFQDKTEVHTTTLDEGIQEIEEKLRELFVRVLNGGVQTVN